MSGGLFNRVGSGLGLLFGGPNDPSLSGADNAQARRFAIMQAGLGLLGNRNPTTEALAQAAMFGQGQGGQYRQQMSQRAASAAQAQARQRFVEQIQNLPPDQALAAAVQYAGQTGDINMLNSFVGALKAQQKEPDKRFVQGGDLFYEIDPATGLPKTTPINERPARAPVYGTPEWFAAKREELKLEQEFRPRGSASRTPRAYVDEATGQTRLGIYNPETGGFDPVEGAAPITGAGSENERKAAAFAQFIPEHVAFVDSFEGAPDRVSQALSAKGLREFTTDEQQQLDLAADAMAEAWLRMTTGAAYNEQEFNNARKFFRPMPGDKAGALSVKKRNRERLQAMLKGLSGRVGVPSGKTPGAFDDLIPKR